MANPLQHAFIAFAAVKVAKWTGFHLEEKAFIIGSLLPDLDFLLFVPFLGRAKGHRTITHSPIFQIFFALFFCKLGFWSLLGGMLLHSLVDSFNNHKSSKGVAWLWPIKWERY